MALEYKLLIKEDEINSDNLKRILLDLDWSNKQEVLSRQSTFFSLENSIGFDIYLLNGNLSVLEIEDEVQEFKNSITFRINKDYEDPTDFKTNMLELVLKIREIVNSEILFLFNGEIIILKSNNERIVIGKTDFWSHQLLKIIDDLDYKQRQFEIL